VTPDAVGPLSGLNEEGSRLPLIIVASAGLVYLLAAGFMLYRDRLLDLLRDR
jgi:hypothetical protein